MGMRKKKEKVTYIDDGRTIADMSGVSGGTGFSKRNPYQPRAGIKEQFQTFWNAMKMMLLPTLAFAGGLVLIFLLIWLIFLIMY